MIGRWLPLFTLRFIAPPLGCSSLRQEGGKLRVAKSGFKIGDTLIIDIAVRDPATQEILGGIEATKHEVDTIDEDNFIPDMLPQLKGRKPGDVAKITHTFPTAWEPEELAGKTTEVCTPHHHSICLLTSRCKTRHRSRRPCR